jgi:surface polysaccharide O-acyltransferase-like enzyme
MNAVTALQKPGRQPGIDAARFGVASLVVLLHAFASVPSTAANLGLPVWIVMACRCAVPFYFIASGYFLAPDRQSPADLVRKPLQRLLPVFLFWMIAYYLFFKVDPIRTWQLKPRDLISGGPAFHLWFLPSLGFGLAVVGLGVRVLGIRLTGLFCLAFGAYSIAYGSYHDVLGLGGEPKQGRIVIAPAFVFVGYGLSRLNLALKPAVAALLIMIANALYVAEEMLIQHWTGAPRLFSHDFTIAMFLTGSALFLFARSLAGGPLVTRAAKLGRISLGIYAAHMMTMWPLSQMIGAETLWQNAVVAALTFSLTTMLVLFVGKMPFMTRFVG